MRENNVKHQKVLLLAPEVFPFPGGAEAYATYLVNTMPEFGWEVICATNKPQNNAKKSKDDKYLYLEPNLSKIVDFRRVAWRTLQFDLLDQLYESIDRISDISIVHANSIESSIIGRIISDHLRVPLVATIHEHAPEKRAFGFGVTSMAFRRLCLDHLIAPSSFYYDRAIANGFEKGKVSIVPHGISVDTLPAPKSELPEIKKNVMSLVFVGRIYPVKGLHVLISALGNLGNSYSFKLSVVGQEVEKGYFEHIKELVRKYKLTEYVEFKGALSHKETTKLIGDSDLLIAPSLNEGFGLAIVEAMFLKTPIIASGVGGISEILTNNKTGILVKPDNPQELGIAIGEFFTDPTANYAMAEVAEVVSRERYCSTTMVKKTIDVYKKTIGNHCDKN